MKISMKRLGAFVLALVMVFGLIPVMNNTANALDVTGLTDDAIGVSYVMGNNPSATAGVKVTAGNALSIVAGGKLVGQNFMTPANTVTITNNGKPPREAVREGGGLSTLRCRVERAGGTMTIQSFPVFELTVTVPKGKEGYAV